MVEQLTVMAAIHENEKYKYKARYICRCMCMYAGMHGFTCNDSGMCDFLWFVCWCVL